MMRRRALALLTLAAALGAGARGVCAQRVDAGRYARLLRMADERRLDSALVRDILAHGAWPERAAAARALGQVGAHGMALTLRALLTDRDSTVAANAAFALGLLRDSASVKALTRALEAPPTVAVEAAWSLGMIGAPARPAIEAALADEGERPTAVTAALLLASAKLRPVPVARIAPYLSHRDGEIRWAAVYAFARPYVPAGVPLVLPLAHDRDPGTRALVARALAHQAAGDSLAAVALPALDTLARDRVANVRVNALRALATYGTPARATVLFALRDPAENVRITAAQALAVVMEGAPRRLWLEAWTADSNFTYRRALLISAVANDVILDAIDEDNTEGWRHMGDWRYRAAVADAGAAAKNVQRMRDISLPLARDPDPRVRAAAYAAIAPWADSAGTHHWRREFMYFALTDWDPVVRATAIGALGSQATVDEALLVARAYPRSALDTLNDARLATVALLRAAWQRDSAHFSDSLVTAIRAMPAPADQGTRDAARDFVLLVAWSQAPPIAGHPDPWYDSVVQALVLPAVAGKNPRAVFATEGSTITLELAALDAPLTVENFIALARAGYYDGVAWHRVVPNFVVQDGDRRGDGNGGPGTTIRDELNRLRYRRGVLGMALSGPDTGGSQYFITISPQPHLDGGYTVFGRVIAGLDVLDAIVQGDAIVSVRISE